MQPPAENSISEQAGDLLERVVEQFTRAVRDGHQPTVESYVEKYPQLANDLPDLLSSIAMIEGLKSFSPSTSQPQSMFGDFEPPEYLGEYRIVREIGRGGMGVVLEAVHETLGRRVAIKVMAPGALTTSQHLDRFHREAIAAASLHHTNIVSVFGAGEDQGFHFYVMEFVDGQSISQLLKSREAGEQETALLNVDGSEQKGQSAKATMSSATSELTPDSLGSGGYIFDTPDRFKWIAKTGLQVADALAYAHEKSLLHRDIKPANLVLDRNDTVWLTDFGLAKPIGDRLDETAMTKTGDILGTPQYMAPESFSGRYDCRSETYCLGLTLYELATLQPAFAKGTTPEVIRAVTAASPTAPRRINRKIPADLATIVEKSIAKEPDLRYQTAALLRDDLRAYLEDRPIAAKRLSLWGQLVRFGRRNRLAAALMAMLVVTLGLLAATGAVGYFATHRALENLQEKQISLQKEQLATQQALKLADENAQKMESQFQRAETNVDVALEAFDQVFRQLIARGTGRSEDLDIDGFQQMAGIEKAITKDDAAFVEKLIQFYQRLAIDSDQTSDYNRDFRTQAATAYRRIANVYRLVGENEKATAAYQAAMATFNQLVQEQPDSAEALLNAVETRNEYSSLIGANGKWRDAITLLVQSRDQLQSHTGYQQRWVKLQLVRTLNQLTSGPVKMIFAQPDQNQLESMDRRDGVDILQGTDKKKLRSAGFGDMFRQIRSEALRAVDLARELTEFQPNNNDFQVARAESLCHLALLERMQGGDALLPLNKAIAELEVLNRSNPDQPHYQYLLAMTRAIASRESKPSKALALLREGQTTLKNLVARFDRILPYRQLYASISIEMAGLQLASGNLDASKANLVLAGGLLAGLRADSVRDHGMHGNVAKLMVTLKSLGDAMAAEGDFNEAAEIELIAGRLEKKLRMSPHGHR